MHLWDPETGESMDVDSLTFAMCGGAGACACTADGCTGGHLIEYSFDMRIEDAAAEGTLASYDMDVGPHDIFLTRQ